MDACAALVSQVPTLVAAICTLNKRPRSASGRHSAGSMRKPAKRRVSQSQRQITMPPTTKRIHARRSVLEARLDHDGIGTPEDRDEHGHGRALEVHVSRRMAQNALEDTTPGIITS